MHASWRLIKGICKNIFVLKDNTDDRLWTTYREVIDFLTCVIELVHYSFYIQEYTNIVASSCEYIKESIDQGKI